MCGIYFLLCLIHQLFIIKCIRSRTSQRLYLVHIDIKGICINTSYSVTAYRHHIVLHMISMIRSNRHVGSPLSEFLKRTAGMPQLYNTLALTQLEVTQITVIVIRYNNTACNVFIVHIKFRKRIMWQTLGTNHFLSFDIRI